MPNRQKRKKRARAASTDPNGVKQTAEGEVDGNPAMKKQKTVGSPAQMESPPTDSSLAIEPSPPDSRPPPPPPAAASSSQSTRPPKGSMLYLADVPEGPYEDTIQSHYNCLGEGAVIQVCIMGHKGLGYVQLKDKDTAQLAAAMDPPMVRGRRIRIEVEGAQGGYPGGYKAASTLFVGSCPDSVEDSHIKEHFKSLGVDPVKSIKWMFNKDGSFARIGFVELQSPAMAEKAVGIGPLMVDGKRLCVRMANIQSRGGRKKKKKPAR